MVVRREVGEEDAGGVGGCEEVHEEEVVAVAAKLWGS